MLMSKGIYCYVDNETGLIDYIGKDSNIHKDKRHNDHYQPSNYDKQPFNRILQKNPNRWEYQRLYESDDVDDETLNQLEITFIEQYNPRFNFTKGGDGVIGYTYTEEDKQKISKALTGRKLSDEHRQNISKVTKRENNPNWKNYARIVKKGIHYNKQAYGIRYEGKWLKGSFYIHKLYKWFGKNYPNQYLYLEVE